MKHIELDAPNIGLIEKRMLNKALASGFISTYGPFVPEFEDVLSRFIGTHNSVSVQSGTAALHLSLYELGIKAGDEVIVPALTFIATVNPVVYVGAKPVFVDVDRNTWCMDPEQIRKRITKKTKAIIPVHLYGNPCDMDVIMKIARKCNCKVIEDATESLGATISRRFTGTFGTYGCFSFNGNKLITTGGGGMVAGNDPKRLTRMKFLANQAKTEVDGGYFHPEIGFNYRMTNIEAALGLAQMSRLESFLEKKRGLHAKYRQALSGIDGITFQQSYPGAQSSHWLTCILFEHKPKPDIPRIQAFLKSKGIPTRRIFMPLIEFPPYKNSKKGEFRNSRDIYARGICLPSSTLNSPQQIDYVCGVLRKLCRKVCA